MQAYPDEEVGQLVTAAAQTTGLAPAAILEDFGEFIAPDLLGMYRNLLKPGWRTLELLENTETTMHRVVRMQHNGSAPPYLQAKRTAPREVTINYTSPRRLCAVAKGIIRGVAKHFEDTVDPGVALHAPRRGRMCDQGYCLTKVGERA